MTVLQHYPSVPGILGLQEARRLARAFLDGGASLDEARPALERLCRERPRSKAPAPDLHNPSTLAVEAVRKLQRGQPLTEVRDVLHLYAWAYASRFGREEPELMDAPAAYREGKSCALVLVRRAFAGDVTEAGRYAVRAVRWWRLRAEEARWPGPRPPTFRQVCDDRVLAAYQQGEIARELAR